MVFLFFMQRDISHTYYLATEENYTAMTSMTNMTTMTTMTSMTSLKTQTTYTFIHSSVL